VEGGPRLLLAKVIVDVSIVVELIVPTIRDIAAVDHAGQVAVVVPVVPVRNRR
jgi:hypothetical protein